MKHILKIFLAFATLVVAQDSTMNVEKEPSLPGWGVYDRWSIWECNSCR